MKGRVVGRIMDYIKKERNFSEEELEIINYGIENLYLQISKIIVITTIAIILNLFIPYILFTIFFNIIRMPSFGVHAQKSYQCWIFSIIIFTFIPLLAKLLELNTILKYILLGCAIIYIALYSPADTYKRPIINPKRRIVYKLLASIISIIYAFLILYIKDQVVSNLILFSLILQCIIISPITYKVLGQPYNNYKNYR